LYSAFGNRWLSHNWVVEPHRRHVPVTMTASRHYSSESAEEAWLARQADIMRASPKPV
jgi:hypothetical protein